MPARDEKRGVILINTGTPDSPEAPDVRAYLRQFLSDPRVIDISPLMRWLLLNLVILPFRPKRSAHAYKQIWTDAGSPLIVNSEAFRDALAEAVPEVEVAVGMAYGKPSLGEAVETLLGRGVDRLVFVPMFPQYASATQGSVLEAAYRTVGSRKNVPPVSVLRPFYGDAGFLDAWAKVAGPALAEFQPDHVMMSFHGLPERHILDSDETGRHCLRSDDCCDRYLDANTSCYRAHCLATARGIAERVGLDGEGYTVCFQSKLGRGKWLQPATNELLVGLAKDGVKRLAVISPAFVADCLETLEELGIRGRDSFLENGGEAFMLVDSLNDHPAWVSALAALLRGM